VIEDQRARPASSMARHAPALRVAGLGVLVSETGHALADIKATLARISTGDQGPSAHGHDSARALRGATQSLSTSDRSLDAGTSKRKKGFRSRKIRKSG